MTLTLQALAALGTSSGGSVLAAVTEMASSDGSGNNLPAIIQGGGSAAAVAGLVYVARLIIKGDLVARPVRDAEAETNANIAATVKRETELQALVGESLARETTLTRLNGETTKVNAELLAELRYWRGQRRDEGRET